VVVHSAGVQDRVGARAVLTRLFCRFDGIVKVFVDGGYTGTLIDWSKQMFGYDMEVIKRNELHTFKTLDRGAQLSLLKLVAPSQQGLRTAPHHCRNYRVDCFGSFAAETLHVVFKQILRNRLELSWIHKMEAQPCGFLAAPNHWQTPTK
jgi:hypothetical protein